MGLLSLARARFLTPILPIGADRAVGRSQSGVALAPSGGRAGGALLTVILHGLRLERRKDGSFCRVPACADSLRRSTGVAGCGDLERADAAVARRA
jgi:hypothetical protein